MTTQTMDSTHKEQSTPQQVQKQVENLRKHGVPGRTVPHQVAYLMDKYPHFSASEMCTILGKSKGAIYSAKHTVIKARGEDENAYKYVRKSSDRVKQSPPQQRIQAGIDEQIATTFEDDLISGIELTSQDEGKPDIWDEQALPFDLKSDGAPTNDVPLAPQPQYTQTIVPKELIVDLQLNKMDGRALTSIVNAVCSQLTDNCKYRLYFRIEED